MFRIKLIPVILIVGFLLSALAGKGQIVKAKQGAVLKFGTGIRVSGASVINKRSNFAVITDRMGFFSILAAEGDTLQVAAPGYTTQTVTVADFRDAIVYLVPVTELQEVVVKGQSLQAEINEVKEGYRSKGVYYNGKPPLLASVVHPLTAINELFGKNAKRARRFNEYAEREIDYQEVSRRFTETIIKSTVPITDAELPIFRSEYMPTVEQIRQWNDYDIVVYIKNSFREFKDNQKNQSQADTTKSETPQAKK